jgi:hypothetical protein
MCLWNIFFALVLSVESESLDALNGGGWRVFIAPTTILAIGWAFCRRAHRTVRCAPDSPVRTGPPIVQCPVPATSADRWGLEQSTIEFTCPCGAQDSPVQPNVVDYF